MIDQKSIYEVVVSEGSYFLKIPLVITSLNHNNEKNFPELRMLLLCCRDAVLF